MSLRPPGVVLQSFGVSGEPRGLAGGENHSWLVEDAVLKPIDDPGETEWVATAMADIREAGFRVPRPLRSVQGTWVSGGWAAWRWVEGEHDLRRRWPEVIEVGGHFHAALAELDKPDFIARRNNPWSVGDRVAWQQEPPAFRNRFLRPVIEKLLGYLRPVDLPSQVIHGDLPGNVLFAPLLSPAVIDFSPYWRPAGFGLAVVVVDAIAWYGANPSLFEMLSHVVEADQLLARAALYRLVTADCTAEDRNPEYAQGHTRAHQPILDVLGIAGR